MQSRLAMTASAFCLFLVAIFLVNCFRAPGTSAASSTGSRRETARSHAPRAHHSSTPLPSGKVLIAGGFGGIGTESHPFSTAELYDPRSGTFPPPPSTPLVRSTPTPPLPTRDVSSNGWIGLGDGRWYRALPVSTRPGPCAPLCAPHRLAPPHGVADGGPP